MIRPTGASQAPERLSALRPPSFRVREATMQNPGRKNASRKRDGLFDMVKWNDGERFSDEPQLATRSPVLILRDASQRSQAVDACELAWAAMLLSMRASTDMLANEATWRSQPAAVGNDRGLALPVSGLLFTGNCATSTCGAADAGPPRIVGVE